MKPRNALNNVHKVYTIQYLLYTPRWQERNSWRGETTDQKADRQTENSFEAASLAEPS